MRLLILVCLVTIVNAKGILSLNICCNEIFENLKETSKYYEKVSSKLTSVLHIKDEDFSCTEDFDEKEYMFSLWFSIYNPIEGNEEYIVDYVADEFFYELYWALLHPYYKFAYKNFTLAEASVERTRYNIENRDIKYIIARVCTMPFAGDMSLIMDVCAEWAELYSYIKKDTYKIETPEIIEKTHTLFGIYINSIKFKKWVSRPFLKEL